MHSKDKMEHHSVVLSLGSNVDAREVFVADAIRWLKGVMRVDGCSAIYSTEECHGCDRIYSNSVVSGEIACSVGDFNILLKSYELSMGRDEEARKKGDVPVDLDIVIADDTVLRPKDFSRRFFQIGFEMIR